MKYFHIDGTIDGELLKRFYEFCNQYPDDDWTISIYTNGGITNNGKTIVHIINQRKGRCTLICHEAYSSGFEIFYMSKCKKILTDVCKGMIHKSSAEMKIDSDRNPIYLEDACIVKNWKDCNDLLKMSKGFLTSKEIKLFKSGGEVYFTAKRMKEIFPDAEII